MTKVSRKGFVDKNGQKVVIVPNVPGATEGNFAGLDENGNLIDSGYAPANFAAADHGHKEIEEKYGASKRAKVYCAAGENTNPAVYISIKTSPMTQKSVQINGDNIDNLDRALEDPDSTPIEDSDKLITSGAMYAALANKKSLEDGEGDYASIVRIGKINHGDDELDAASVYGKDAIRLGVLGGLVYIDAENIANLKSALLGLEISFVRDENGDYAIDSNLKEYLNDLLEEMPADKCVPCVVHAQWWNGSSYVGGHFPGALCHHSFTTTGIPRTIYLSFLGNLFYATRTANNDFPNVWTKFENPFATVSAGDGLDSDDSGNNGAVDDEPNDGLDG